MGFLDKLKGLFTGDQKVGDDGIYLYVKLDKGGEIVRIRLTPQQELVPDYEGGYRTHKSIVGPNSFARADAVFYFDSGRRLTNADITGGELTTEEQYIAYKAAKAASQPPESSSPGED